MEWVETTAKTVEAAKELALDRLGVAADEADFEVLEEPRGGLFGRVRGEARVRARIRPTAVRPKQDRRRDRKEKVVKDKTGKTDKGGTAPNSDDPNSDGPNSDNPAGPDSSENLEPDAGPNVGTVRGAERVAHRASSGDRDGRRPKGNGESRPKQTKEHDMNETTATPEQVGEAAVAFMSGLADAFGATSTTTLAIDGDELDVRTTGTDLGVLVGPGGRTLNAIQDLVRVAAQRRLGDHETRLRIDVAGYREKRKGALEQFAQTVAAQVVETGQARALEPMSSADRKVVHDAIGEIDGVVSRSDGEDPSRRVVIAPA